MTDAEFIRQFPTIDAYLAHHQAAGHICCGCIQLMPPFPCCNPGHYEADRKGRPFDPSRYRGSGVDRMTTAGPNAREEHEVSNEERTHDRGWFDIATGYMRSIKIARDTGKGESL